MFEITLRSAREYCKITKCQVSEYIKNNRLLYNLFRGNTANYIVTVIDRGLGVFVGYVNIPVIATKFNYLISYFRHTLCRRERIQTSVFPLIANFSNLLTSFHSCFLSFATIARTIVKHDTFTLSGP